MGLRSNTSLTPLEELMNWKNSQPWYQNSDTLGAYAGLASALTGIAGFKDQKDLLNTQTEALKQNIAFAREDQERRNKNISGFNSFTPSSPVSAFAPKI